MENQSIVVLDFGSQYTQLIARRIREQNVFSVVLPCTASLKEIKSYSPGGIILSGGPSSVYEPGAPTMDVIITVCDNAAGEVCPLWPGRPITAHWSIEDPAAVEGSEDLRLQAFDKAFQDLDTRIKDFTANR